MKINKLNIIVTALVVVATIIIAVLLKPEEPTKLFYVNIVICVILEILAINSVLTISKSQNFTQQNIATARQILSLSAQCLFWLLIFSLLLTRYIDWEWYYIGYITIVVINVTLVLVIHTAGKKQIKINKNLAENVMQKNASNIDLQLSKIQISKNIEKCDADKPNIEVALQSLNLLIEKLRVRPASNFVETKNKIDNYLSQIISTNESLKSTQGRESSDIILAQMTALLNETIEYVNEIKRY